MTEERVLAAAKEAGFDVSVGGIFNPHTTDESELNVELTKFAQAIRRQALEEAAPKWTSVKDGLPTYQDMYLVRYTGDGGYDLMTMEAVIDNQHDLLEWMPVPHNNARDGSSEGDK
jgi:hypothetical protein